MESALARTFNGKISPVTTQATGPPIRMLAITKFHPEGFLTGRSETEDEDADKVSL